MQHSEIIKAMEAHAKAYGLKVTTIGHLAVGNRHAYARIKKGTAHRDTGVRVFDWIEADKAQRSGPEKVNEVRS